MGAMPASHENSPWGTPHAGGNAMEELARHLNLIQLHQHQQQQQQQQQQHMAHHMSDSALSALSLSQQLHQQQPGWAGPSGFNDTFKPSSWSAGRPQRDKASR